MREYNIENKVISITLNNARVLKTMVMVITLYNAGSNNVTIKLIIYALQLKLNRAIFHNKCALISHLKTYCTRRDKIYYA